jgi:hypothetical protein
MAEEKMATIKTESITPWKRVAQGQGFAVNLSVQTSTARITFPFEVEDQGSPAANESLARHNLRIFLQEALRALEES